MKKSTVKLTLAVLGLFLLLSQSMNTVFSYSVPDVDHGSVNGELNLDHTIYLPLIMNNITSVPNGNFELGRVTWTEYSTSSGNVLILNSGFPDGISPHGGSWAAWLGQDHFYPLDESITQTVFIPLEKTKLHFWYWIRSTEPNATKDYFKVLVYSVDPVVYMPLFTGSQTADWVEYTVDLSAYAGESVIMIFTVHLDWNNDSWVFLDDISLQNE